MKRILATAAIAALAVGGVAVAASPAQANSVFCYVTEYDVSVVPGSHFTRDGATILGCTGNPYAPTRTVTTCQPPEVAVNSEPEAYQGQDGNTYYRMTASCQ